jgi:hypothetical protein
VTSSGNKSAVGRAMRKMEDGGVGDRRRCRNGGGVGFGEEGDDKWAKTTKIMYGEGDEGDCMMVDGGNSSFGRFEIHKNGGISKLEPDTSTINQKHIPRFHPSPCTMVPSSALDLVVLENEI